MSSINEDEEDIRSLEERKDEPTETLEDFLKALKADELID